MSFNPNEHMMSLKGKDYLQVAWRLVWFREEHPNWQISTSLLSDTGERAVCKAEIFDEDGFLLSTGHGSETTKDFHDNLEKAETKAVGRALAMLGYGTQFAPELDEEERIVDSPVQRKQEPIPRKAPEEVLFTCDDCGAVLKPYTGKDGKEVGVRKHAFASQTKFGKVLCLDCINKAQAGDGA